MAIWLWNHCLNCISSTILGWLFMPPSYNVLHITLSKWNLARMPLGKCSCNPYHEHTHKKKTIPYIIVCESKYIPEHSTSYRTVRIILGIVVHTFYLIFKVRLYEAWQHILPQIQIVDTFDFNLNMICGFIYNKGNKKRKTSYSRLSFQGVPC